ncbi:tRNA 2-selenouridine synthase-like [Dreissena polymorpha]|uniref:Rhodanese domain-containing protein n=1 Tax=Dreissena polymorpha TaxID=45954 RepID=A0A9D4BGH0_DREPO|nr:tRNA 2-selenouridine synthase-like [Dreissena polymorpha]XP_052256564.1 tRNA 2-selenouridine synthase-like [Dreissena polymorpha]XP_052256565.1 tRNA 2-selenouridine synthase-like [Dreissena polymorpha]XP_052258294.1 tRNA 2-selenouridine synthase-like [Dreissena polymorpha]XP_052258295.1 tRNA 2-selenouridine synthase-like [Dreissena polymorpha]XP_052258296.1 tRNA 2-selenouridine synthase-like [Dreissena polymorpha]XP_052258297.1 tRNA 2-selenouridine synthase-like [Dreissena polymorpha]KAH3
MAAKWEQFCRLKAFVRHYHRKKPSIQSFPEIISNYKHEQITDIIDVRTPNEFHEDHIPGAVNIPVLSNEERVIVGTVYSKSAFEARKLGASLISKNISEHLKNYFYQRSQDYSPLVYCWRGGQRSYSLGLVLAQIGFQIYMLDGGYKHYRETVREDLKSLPYKFQYRIISGLTGSGKTHILHALGAQGHQILDLEGLARHKGSVLGLWHGETQPSQKFFETQICDRLQNFVTDRPVWLESESVRIGNVFIPPDLFQSLKESPRFCVCLPLAERVKHIIKDYPNWIENKEQLKEILGKLIGRQSKEVVNSWIEMISRNQWEEFVERMLLEHYDPTYSLSQKKNNVSQHDVVHINVVNLNEDTVFNVASKLAELGSMNVSSVHMAA